MHWILAILCMDYFLYGFEWKYKKESIQIESPEVGIGWGLFNSLFFLILHCIQTLNHIFNNDENVMKFSFLHFPLPFPHQTNKEDECFLDVEM